MANTIATMILACADMDINMMREDVTNGVATALSYKEFMLMHDDLKTLEKWVNTRAQVAIWADTGDAPPYLMDDSNFQRWLKMANENDVGD